ncbi:MAG: translation initiation factor IF-3 [Firmicutes bacterium]|nr:translation initiation factor IF-3 [Bacillota bacterium]MBR3403774.1 translation initiation factor IF-3 [Bacillota bacterium]
MLFGGAKTISEQLINEEIRDREVRLIDQDGTQLGIVATKDALNTAYEKNLDLVMIAPNSKPPVCKIMDYSKYRFDQMKKEKEAKKKQKVTEVKEVRLSPNIGDHDFDTKLKNASKFLQDGNKVKVSVRFRGREITHNELGRDVLLKFADAISSVGSIDKAPKMEGRSMVMFLQPKSNK